MQQFMLKIYDAAEANAMIPATSKKVPSGEKLFVLMEDTTESEAAEWCIVEMIEGQPEVVMDRIGEVIGVHLSDPTHERIVVSPARRT